MAEFILSKVSGLKAGRFTQTFRSEQFFFRKFLNACFLSSLLTKHTVNCDNLKHSIPQAILLWLFEISFWVINPAGIYLLKVNNTNTRTRCEICSKTPERRH